MDNLQSNTYLSLLLAILANRSNARNEINMRNARERNLNNGINSKQIETQTTHEGGGKRERERELVNSPQGKNVCFSRCLVDYGNKENFASMCGISASLSCALHHKPTNNQNKAPV